MSDWISEHTRGMLRPPINANPDDALVLINALISDGRWVSMFDKERTRPETFHSTHGDTSTPMMRGVSTVTGYARSDGWTKVTLPFEGYSGGLSVILPDDPSRLRRNPTRP